jgi:putative FmdB family regulatory protein
MPIFEYSCDACHHEFETLVRTGDTPACPKCAATALTKLLSLPAIKSESTHNLALRAAHRQRNRAHLVLQKKRPGQDVQGDVCRF